jgi:regulator of sigma E protease
VITILATILILGVLIFVHELGHFATAKWVDIEVPRFSIGLGPKMIGFTRGETEYVIAWLPLGGYVRMAGMDDMEALEGGEHDAETARSSGRDFESKSLPARALVISAGVIMNMLFAWLVFAVIAMVWGVRQTPAAVVGDVNEDFLTEETAALLDVPIGGRITAVNGRTVEDWRGVEAGILASDDSLRFTFEGGQAIAVPVPAGDTARSELYNAVRPRVELPAVADTVVPGSAAERAGLLEGDRVVSVAGQPVAGWQEMVAAVEPRPGEAVDVVVERDGERVTLTLTPDATPVEAAPGRTVGRIGVGPSAAAFPRDRLGPLAALGHGAERTGQVTALIVGYLGGLFTGDESPRDVGGPILIYQISEQMVQVGLEAVLDFMALFSINLAILNLLPIPILDGGQLLFLAVEGIRGRALSVEQRMRLSQVGLVMVVAIMVWALANDVLRLFGL